MDANEPGEGEATVIGGSPSTNRAAMRPAEDPPGPGLFSSAKDSLNSPVFAIGHVKPMVPTLAVEKELAQAIARDDGTGRTDHQTLQRALTNRRNRYLARHICWVFTIEGLETYMLIPQDPSGLDQLIESLRTDPHPGDVDVVIGARGPIARPDMCNGLALPMLALEQMWSFDRASLLEAIPRPTISGENDGANFEAAAGELFDRIMQVADNAGATDEHRALNYLAVRYPAIYAKTSEAHQQNATLIKVEVKPSRLSGARKIVNVILSYSNRSTDVTESYFVRVDVTEQFPFIVTKLSPYYER